MRLSIKIRALSIFLSVSAATCYLTMGCGASLGDGPNKPHQLLRFINLAPSKPTLSLQVDNDNSSSSSSTSSSASSTARLAAEPSLSLNLLAKEQLQVNKLAYGAVSDYIDVITGKRTIETRDHINALPIISETQTVESGKVYTYVVYEKDKALTTLFQTDDISTEPDNDGFRVRVGHFSTTADKVDLYLVTPGSAIGRATVALSGVENGTISDYLDVKEGKYQVKFTVADSTKLKVDGGTIEISAGRRITLLLINQKGNRSKPWKVIQVEDTPV